MASGRRSANNRKLGEASQQLGLTRPTPVSVSLYSRTTQTVTFFCVCSLFKFYVQFLLLVRVLSGIASLMNSPSDNLLNKYAL